MTDRDILLELADRVSETPITGRELAEWFYHGRQTAENEPSGRIYYLMREIRQADLCPDALAGYLRAAAYSMAEA
ncbi:MAG TPA: hypothetical protein PLS23_08510 [Phycisphaerae bacterium]|nr:hypothetical protein [Phycisphaerae bacterium]